MKTKFDLLNSFIHIPVEEECDDCHGSGFNAAGSDGDDVEYCPSCVGRGLFKYVAKFKLVRIAGGVAVLE